MPVAACALLGASAWSLSEYVLHRFAGHGRVRRRPGRLWWLTPRLPLVVFYEEHVAHHRDPTSFGPTWMKALAALLLVPVLGALASLAAGWAAGLAFGLAYAIAYLAYEVLHRRIHTHPPTNRYLRWMRLHHLQHHVAPRMNHGVTSPLWDRVFRTHEPRAPVRLPQALAPSWLLDRDTGLPRPEYRADYELSGR